MLYYKSVGVLMHNIAHDFVPQNLKNLFTRLPSIHSYNTRAAATGKFHVIHLRTKQQNQSFSRIRPKIWNKIPELLKSKPKQPFKKHLQTNLLQCLVHKGVYVDVHILLINYYSLIRSLRYIYIFLYLL